jgi:fucose 4-O-acetylase-like acetyltransferase
VSTAAIPSSRAAGAARLPWIDVVKGIGILTIVAFHVWDGFSFPLTSLYALPVFFFSNGYRLRVRDDSLGYLRDKSYSLLVPYVCFLAVLSAPELIHRYHEAATPVVSTLRGVAKTIYGGASLPPATAPYWFITALFFAQQLAHTLLRHLDGRSVGVAAAGLLLLTYAYTTLAPGLLLPWALHAVPFATAFVLLGYYVKRTGFELPLSICVPVVLAAAALLYVGYPFRYDMRVADFGVPVLLPVASVCAISVIVAVARLLGRSRLLTQFMERIGQASLVILLTHQAIQLFLEDHLGIASAWLRFALATALAYLLWDLLRRQRWCRAVLLGDRGALPPPRRR